jgi:hypothetical protein
VPHQDIIEEQRIVVGRSVFRSHSVGSARGHRLHLNVNCHLHLFCKRREGPEPWAVWEYSGKLRHDFRQSLVAPLRRGHASTGEPGGHHVHCRTPRARLVEDDAAVCPC